MEINLKNIEQKIFMNKEIRALLPELKYIFDQWEMSYRIPGLQMLGKKSIADLLNILQSEHIDRIRNFLKEDIELNKLNHKLVDHYDFNETDEEQLCKFSEYKDFCLYRKSEEIKVTFWR